MRMPWFKAYDDLWTSPSHAELDGDALYVGLVLMSFVRAACDALGDWTPWATLPSGAPVSTTAIARKARKTVEIVEDALRGLVEAGTVEQRGDGAWGLPKFQQHQQGESTPRAKKSKAKKAAATIVADVLPMPAANAPTRGGVAQRMTEIATLVEKLSYGWNDHPPPTPKGMTRLFAYKQGLEKLLDGGLTIAEILEAVDRVAEIVEAGELPEIEWTPTRVFSGYLGEMLAKHSKWKRSLARRAEQHADAHVPEVPAIDFDDLASKAAAAAAKYQKGGPACTS